MVAATLIPLIAQAGIGAWQWYKSSQMDQERPEYEIPESYKNALTQQRQLAYGEMPGLQRAEQRTSQATANAVSQMNRAGVTDPNAIAGAYMGEQQRQADIGTTAARYRTQMRQNYAQALNRMGQLEDRQWDYNVNQPYQREMQQKAALLGSAQQNIMGATRGVGQYAQSVEMRQSAEQRWQDYLEMMKNQQGNPYGSQYAIPPSLGTMGDYTPIPAGLG